VTKTVALGKRATKIILHRLAPLDTEPEQQLYARVLSAWINRADNRTTKLTLNDDERALLREHCATELQLAGVRV
jgi:hypothetical protein